ncbi:helix-turn-helix transcriptional regulator [Flavobacterium sp. LB1P62]|uniref:helix-turn-helix transcriptional regulator n=1 Tax=Flavobacterium sp. LB1P62 TaxID=3401715 RepID=UPI003AAFEFD4
MAVKKYHFINKMVFCNIYLFIFTVKAVKMNDFNLGLFIKEHRKQAGLTQLELANLAGVGKTTIFDIEKNKETVRWNNLLAVLKVLNIEIQFKSPINK